VQQGAIGNAQGINITARSLSLTNGAQLNAVTSGQGDAGNILINTSNSVSVSGTNTTVAPIELFNYTPPRFTSPPEFVDGVSSGIFTSTNSSGVGGNIEINTSAFSVWDGAVIDARTTANGPGGAISINTNTFEATSGGQLTAITSGSGAAGNISIEATDTVTITGSDPSYSARLAQFGSQLDLYGKPKVGSIGAGSGLFANTEASSAGSGGNIQITTGQFTIQDQAQATVSSSGAGIAGSLFVDADAIRLDTEGRIRADTTGGGGNINLRSPLILLRNASSITTNATGSNIPGGNISIDTDNLVAVPNENSDISANSANFRGGNVIVRANGIFGIEFREQLTPLSDITATGVSSEFSGTVDIITPGIDPARGLAELPTEVVDASDAIAQSCRDVQGSSFVITGRGGLPPTPQQALGDDPRWRDWRTPAEISHQPNTTENGTLPPSAHSASTKSALVEATGWVIEPDGNVILTARQVRLM
jgi:large exoprotein involved in heme utilization and adhesion